MKLNTGRIAIPIEFEDRNEVENIYFNPADPDIVTRFEAFGKNIEEKIKGLADVELDAEGKPINENDIEVFKELRNAITDEIDYAFGSNISDVVFKYCNPFAIVNGEYFVFQFINAIMPVIENHIKKANEKTMKNIEKHIRKYQK